MAAISRLGIPTPRLAARATMSDLLNPSSEDFWLSVDVGWLDVAVCDAVVLARDLGVDAPVPVASVSSVLVVAAVASDVVVAAVVEAATFAVKQYAS